MDAIPGKDKNDKSNRSFKYSIAVWTKCINTKAVIFFLSVSCIKTFNFTFRSLSLKERHDHIFKATGFVLSRCGSTGFWIKIPSCVQSSRHSWTHWVWVKVISFKSNYGLANIRCFPNKGFINNCFACGNDIWITNNIFSDLLRKIFISSTEGVQFSVSWFVQANISQVWECATELQKINVFAVVKEKRFSIASKVGAMSLLLYQRTHLFLFRKLLQVLIVLASSWWRFCKLKFSHCLICSHSSYQKLNVLCVFRFERVSTARFTDKSIIRREFCIMYFFGVIKPLIREITFGLWGFVSFRGSSPRQEMSLYPKAEYHQTWKRSTDWLSWYH